MRWIRTWPGGRVRELDDGTLRWYIIKRLGSGVRKSVALDVDNETDAMAQYGHFQTDPAGFKTRKQRAAETIRRASASGGFADLADFLRWATAQKEAGALSKNYVERVLAPYLGEWAKAIGPRPFAQVTLGELTAKLNGWETARQKRIVAIKAFTHWLRSGDSGARLRRQDDPTLDLSVPSNTPEQSVRPKGYSIKQIEILYRHLTYQVVRDMLVLKAKIGLHETEIDRLARGKGELRRVGDKSGIEGVLVFAHLKKGGRHVVSVDAQTFAAAERLLSRGRAAANTVFVREFIKASEAINTDTEQPPAVRKLFAQPLKPGELRHSFATWAVSVGVEVKPTKQRGVDLAKVAERMGHLQKKTTAAFYVGDVTPMMIKIPIRLEHPKDPPVVKPRRA